MAKTQEDREPMGRATDDEVANTANEEFDEDDDLDEEEEDSDAEDVE
jgi:hypothetical protein